MYMYMYMDLYMYMYMHIKYIISYMVYMGLWHCFTTVTPGTLLPARWQPWS